MTTLNNKIDFALIFSVKNANPNGDPLNGNRPRANYDGFGEVTDVCIKRKIRDRLIERYDLLPKSEQEGQAVFVQSEDRKAKGDNCKSLRERFKAERTLQDLNDKDKVAEEASRIWIDVRSFGQVFPFKSDQDQKEKDKNKKDKKKPVAVKEPSGDEGGTNPDGTLEEHEDAIKDSVSVGVRGPITVQSAFSVEKISISSNQITKSVNLETTKDGRKSADTMGMKHRVDQGVYVTYGSMNPQLAERTGFSDADAEVIKSVLPKMFENDASSARPEGSMEVLTVVWWKHTNKSGQYSSSEVHRSLKVNADGTYVLNNLKDLKPEEIKGF